MLRYKALEGQPSCRKKTAQKNAHSQTKLIKNFDRYKANEEEYDERIGSQANDSGTLVFEDLKNKSHVKSGYGTYNVMHSQDKAHS